MFVLYKQYLSGITILVILMSISTAFGTAGAFTKTILIKYTKTANLVGVYIMYFIVLSILGIILSKIYSLIRICFCYRNI